VSHKKQSSFRNIAAIAREAAPDAIERLVLLMSHTDPHVAMDACKHVLDRAVGKPISMTADVTDRLDELTDPELEAAIDDLTNRIGIAAKAAGKETAPPVTH
jgi:hypothetical protein